MEVISMLSAVRRGMEDNLYNYTVNGKCSSCGNCCSNILPMSRKEIDTIKKYIKKNEITERKHLLPVAGKNYDMICPFRDNTKKICTIYPVRPEICKQFICDNEKRVKHNRKLLRQTRTITLVRETFFGGCDEA